MAEAILFIARLSCESSVSFRPNKLKTERRRKMIGCWHSYAHEDLESVRDVNKSLLDQIDEFFTSYNKMRGKTFKIKKRAGPKQALAILKDGIKAYKKSKTRSNGVGK